MKEILLFIFTVVAFFVKALTGFGDTLVMATLFSFLIPNSITTPVNLLVTFPTNIYITFKERKNLSLKIIIPFTLTLFVGIIPGTFLLTHMSNWIIKSILGIVVVAIAIEMITRKSEQKSIKSNPVLSVIIGVCSGLLGGLFGIGALLAAYISRITDNKNQLRGNLCCIFLLENIFRIILYIVSDIFNRNIINMTIMILPAVILGLFIGIKVDSKLKDETIKKITVYLLIISGAFLFVQNVMFH